MQETIITIINYYKRSRSPNYREVSSLILSDGGMSSDNTATSSSTRSQKQRGMCISPQHKSLLKTGNPEKWKHVCVGQYTGGSLWFYLISFSLALLVFLCKIPLFWFLLCSKLFFYCNGSFFTLHCLLITHTLPGFNLNVKLFSTNQELIFFVCTIFAVLSNKTQFKISRALSKNQSRTECFSSIESHKD